MRTAYRVRAYPTAEQAAALNRTFGCVRLVWNTVLAWRQARYRAEGVKTSYAQTDRYLTELKRDGGHDFLYEVSSVPLQQALRHQHKAFANFFAGRAKHPRFKIPNPRHLERKAKNLARYQRRMARKQRGSNNRAKARAKVARAHTKVRDARADFLHRTSARLVRDHDLIVLEDLNVRGMVRNRSLARVISDCGWGEFRRQLEYKTQRYGRRLVVIDRWYPSSKTCSACGHLLPALPLSTRHWMCPGCGTRNDRDVNAAKNILAAGRAVSACGADVSHSGSSRMRSAVKQEAQPARAGVPRL
ncbi:RNA-guided endonuclease TnpB family protein [Microbispora sp. H13382]|uniref:RNA-guided endonuclease InsQ/TnpB family protein n=1 Tax=Microbispora sp. H13382 TaxID=2729112 RepID=UPI00160026A7|nr:RNA-guided endonuclease TnpB family protein [Microbispora sp. H13382]